MLQKSPFSGKPAQSTPNPSPPTTSAGVKTYWDFYNEKTGKTKANTTTRYGGSSSKTSAQEEQDQLDTAVINADARLAENLSGKNYERLQSDLFKIQKTGQVPEKKGRGVFGYIANKLGNAVSESLKPIGYVFKELDESSKAAQAYLKEASDVVLAGINYLGGQPLTDYRPVVSSKQAQAFFEDPNKKLINTGISYIDKPVDFVVDTLTNAGTYVTAGTGAYMGLAGRTVLATELLTVKNLAKYPILKGLESDIIRYGVNAVPREIRQEVGIQSGIHIFGQMVPHTDVIASAITGKFGLISGPRRLIGDAISKLPNSVGTYVQRSVVPQSVRGLVDIGANRVGSNNERVIGLLAARASTSLARGVKNTEHALNMDAILPTLKEIVGYNAKNDVKVAIHSIIEDPVLFKAASPQQQKWAQSIIDWQDGLRNAANDDIVAFGKEFMTNIREIGFIDNYVMHKMDKDAVKFLANEKNSAFKALFQSSALTADELVKTTGAVRHRSLRKPTFDKNTGVLLDADEFMGEKLITNEMASIDGINAIWRDKTGLKTNFFSTNINEIVESYSYSMATSRARTAYARRSMDFGIDVIRPLIDKSVPDKLLAASLLASHKTLKNARLGIYNAVRKQHGRVASAAKDSIQFLDDIITQKVKSTAMNAKDIAAVENSILSLQNQLIDAVKVAMTTSVAERGAFFEQWKPLMEELHALKTALAENDLEKYGIVKELQHLYNAVYPSAKRVPSDVSTLIERIQVARGIAAPKELRELEKRSVAITQQIEEEVAKGTDPQFLNDLLDEEVLLNETIKGISVLGDIRVDAPYAESGFLYTIDENLLPRVFDENIPSAPYRTMDTHPMQPNTGGNYNQDEAAAFHEFFMTAPESVAVHAIPVERLLNTSTVDGYEWLFDGARPNSVGDAVGKALDMMGLNGSTWDEAWTTFVREGTIDPLFAQVEPEMATLIARLGQYHYTKFDDDLVPEEVLLDNFQEIHGLLEGIAFGAAKENSDIAGRELYDNVLGYLTENLPEQADGLLLPSQVVHGMENLTASGQNTVLIPDSFGYSKGLSPQDLEGSPMSAVHFVQDDEMVTNILRSDYISSSLAASERSAAILNEVTNAQENLAAVARLKGERIANNRAAGKLKAAGTRKEKELTRIAERFAKTGELEVTVSGKKVIMTEKQAIASITKAEKKISGATGHMESTQAKRIAGAGKKIEEKLTQQEERLVGLLDTATDLRGWNDTVGSILQKNIDDLRVAVAEQPPKGAAGVESRAWTTKVQRTMDQIPQIQDKRVAKAYDRVTTLLHANESQLALMDDYVAQSAKEYEEVLSGKFGALTYKGVLDGWTELKNLGVQMPTEITELWQPSLKEMFAKQNVNKYWKVHLNIQQFFKTYVTATPGFGVRNAFSATFMNVAKGVRLDSLTDGFAGAMMLMKHGPKEFIERLPAAAQEEMREAMRIVAATGHGSMDELGSLTIRGSGSEKILNNWFTRGNKRFNTHIENAVRLPAALDSLRRGMSFDSAVRRVVDIHFDYSDLSKLDEAAKQIVPFWIWTTRNIPLQIATQYTRPSAYIAYENLRAQFPVDADFPLPSYIREQRPLQIAAGTFLAIDLPQNRLQQTFNSFLQPERLIGQMAPDLKILPEMIMNKQLALDIPFSDKMDKAKGLDYLIARIASAVGANNIGAKNPETGEWEISPKASYIMSQVPQVAQAERLSGGLLGGKPTYKERQLDSLLNYAGIPIKAPKEGAQRSEIIGRQFKVKDFMKDLQKAGLIQKKD